MNKVAIVTGGARGLGRAIVERLVNENYRVCFTYLESEAEAKEIIKQYNGRVMALHADASDFESAENVIKQCLHRFNRIDVLINNASRSKDSNLEKLNVNYFNYTIQHVLNPVFNYTKAITDYFIRERRGKIISIGSINGERGREGSVAYSTAKAGIIGFTKTIAKELGRYGITANVVSPGFIHTESQKNTSELIKKLVLQECSIKHLTEPDEVVNLVLFLASEQANCITGQVYRIDCGQYI